MSKKAGTDENGDVKQASLEDSNMSNYGSKEHKDLRKGAAQSEKEFVGAGVKPGLEIWRVENRRTKSDTPDFGVKRWPKDDYGSFYSGDSYLVLNTYKVKVDGKETDKLGWDVHFWLGKESSQDEIGVAAYKAVELDDLLDDGPVQHREVQGHESALFQSYFVKGIQYMEGGIASGFRQVKPDEYKPRLFQVRRTRKAVRAFEVPVKASSMNHGDVFILDNGLQVFMFIGEHSNAFEKMKGGTLASGIVSARQGKSKFFPEVNDDFWKVVGGSVKDVGPADEREEEESDRPIDADKCKLYRLSDASGKLTFSKEFEGKITDDKLDQNDVFIVDCDIEIFVWIGKGASQSEKSQCMKFAMDYLKAHNKPATIPITRIMQGQIHHVFGSIVSSTKGSGIARAVSKPSLGGGSSTAPKATVAAPALKPTFGTAGSRTSVGSSTSAAPLSKPSFGNATSSAPKPSTANSGSAGSRMSVGSTSSAAKPASTPGAAPVLKSSGQKLW